MQSIGINDFTYYNYPTGLTVSPDGKHGAIAVVNANEEISALVPIHAIGEAIGAAHGGILEQELHELEVLCHPTELPELIKVDVSKLDMGDMLHVSDIVLPSGVKTKAVRSFEKAKPRGRE